jgi:hypothetical protein
MNRALKSNICNKEEVTDSRRNLHNVEIHTMHSSPDIIILLNDEIKKNEIGE